MDYFFTSDMNRNKHYKKHVCELHEPFDIITPEIIKIKASDNCFNYEKRASFNINHCTYLYPARDNVGKNTNMGFLSIYNDTQELTLAQNNLDNNKKNIIITYYIPKYTYLSLYLVCNYYLYDNYKIALLEKGALEPLVFLNRIDNNTINENSDDDKLDTTLFSKLFFNTYKQYKVEGDYRIKNNAQKLLHLYCKNEIKELEKHINKCPAVNNTINILNFIIYRIEISNHLLTKDYPITDKIKLIEYLQKEENFNQINSIKFDDSESTLPPVIIFFEYYFRKTLLTQLSSEKTTIIEPSNIEKKYHKIEETFEKNIKEYGTAIQNLFNEVLGF